jgi:hypothetical protein
MKSHRRSVLPSIGAFVLFLTFAVSNGYGQLNSRVVDPLKQQPNSTAARVNICHVTGSQTNPSFELTEIPEEALKGHLGHGDIYPVPATGCPSGGAGDPDPTPLPGGTPEPITILLFGSGLAAAGFVARRSRRKKLEDLDT